MPRSASNILKPKWVNPRALSATTQLYRQFSLSSNHRLYEKTVHNLRIGSHTRVIFQGFTGKQATANAKESIAWGTNIVGGVTPGKHGEHLNLPVLPTVREAMRQLQPDATGIYVAAQHAAAAIEEAIEAEVPLIVAVAEHIPLHDVLRIHSILKTQSKSRLVGANAPGIISAIGRCRIGFQPLPTFSPGNVGIVAKSGTLSYETVASLTRAGVGQSLCIGMGGDVIAGTDFVDALRVFEHDEDTKAIIIVGEIGGTAELEAADWIREYRQRVTKPKPIAALIAGVHAMPGRIMGHAGAWVGPGEADARRKYKILQDVGVTMVDHPARFGGTMKSLLGDKRPANQYSNISPGAQRRGYHSSSRFPIVSQVARPRRPKTTNLQKRKLSLSAEQATRLLAENEIEVTTTSETEEREQRLLIVTIDRSSRCPCVIASPTTAPAHVYHRARRFPYDYRSGITDHQIQDVVSALQLDASPPRVLANTTKLIRNLTSLYQELEAVSLRIHLSLSPTEDKLLITSPTLTFDDAAFRSTKRQQALHALRDITLEDPVEVSAEASGIVYIKLHTPTTASANIGTLVNGAGLAMNTVDALAAHGGQAANFLDTGGKATSETVKRSFELILSDERVKVVFVNIFGGLTLCDMIAEGIILAFKELEMKVPVVVRLRGTNESIGQKIIGDSGLPLHVFDDFDEAAEKAIELAGGAGDTSR